MHASVQRSLATLASDHAECEAFAAAFRARHGLVPSAAFTRQPRGYHRPAGVPAPRVAA